MYGAIWENGPPEERDTVLKIQAPANDWEWYILNQVIMCKVEKFQKYFSTFVFIDSQEV